MAETNGDAFIHLEGVHKAYPRGREAIAVLHGLDLRIPEGAFVSLMGPSGSGKTTLLNLIAGLDRPSGGRIVVAGAELTRMSRAELARFRSANIGFVFQACNLIPVLRAVENVELPLLRTSLGRAERHERAMTALGIVGLEDRARHYPGELSGGQEQRVAVARAVVTDPRILVADEPTGDLDRQSADQIIALLSQLHRDLGKTVVVVTHDPLVAERASIRHRLDKGRLEAPP
jgi:putative ABC transport system ATP-binding protein